MRSELSVQIARAERLGEGTIPLSAARRMDRAGGA